MKLLSKMTRDEVVNLSYEMERGEVRFWEFLSIIKESNVEILVRCKNQKWICVIGDIYFASSDSLTNALALSFRKWIYRDKDDEK